MNFNSITFIINISVVLFLTIGLIMGMQRGALKSFVRLSFLVFNCIFWVVITPEISRFILNVNLYPLLNITSNGQTFTTIADFTNYFLTTNPLVLEIIASSPIIANFIEQLPNIVANFVVFIAGYFLLKSITLPVYAFVVNRIIKLIQMKSTKQIDPDRKKLRSRFFGALLGLVQSALTGMILFLPISTLSIVLSGAQDNNMFSSPNLYVSENAVMNVSNNTTYIEPTKPTTAKIDEFVNIYYNTMLSNTLNAMNLNGLNEFLFKELSTINVNGVKISLAEELKTVNKLMQQTNTLLKENNITNLTEVNTVEILKLIANMDYKKCEKLLNTLFELKSLNLIGDDLLNYLYSNLSLDNKTIDEHLNTLPDSIKPIANNLLLSLRTGNIRLLKEDVLNLFYFVETLQKNGVFDFAKNASIMNNLEQALKQNDDALMQQTSGQILTFIIQNFSKYSEKDLQNKLITPLFRSATVRRMMSDILNLFIETLNESLNLNIEKVSRVSVSWSNETVKLAKLTYLIKEISKDIPLNTNIDLTDTALLQKVPYQKIGALLNTLRESQLFSYLYQNALTQIFNNYFVPVDEQNNAIKFEFVSLNNTNWESEFLTLGNIINSFANLLPYVNSNFENMDTLKISKLIEDAFKSNLVKEVLVKSKNLLPQIVLGYLDNLPLSEQKEHILNTIKISLQEMSIEQIYNDLITFSNMLHVIIEIKEPDITSKLLKLNEQQITYLLEQFNTSYLGTKLLPQTINLVIAKINDMFNLNIIYLSEVVKLNSNDIQKMSSAIFNVKTVYNEYVLLDKAQKQREVYSLQDLVKNLNVKKVGTAINKVKSIPVFSAIYNDIITNVALNKEFLNNLINTQLFSYLHLTQHQINSINWELEVEMVKNALIIGIDVQNIKEYRYNSIRIDLFLQNYGDSVFLKLGFINAILSLYPNTNIQAMINLNLKQGAVSVGGIAEAVFLFLDFKHNGTVKVKLIEAYRIREALIQIDSNSNLLTFINELTKINTIKYSELATLVDTLVLLLEGKEFSIKEFSNYLNAAPLIPWVVELLGKISKGYKMPYYLNLYMRVDLFNARIKLYGIHIGNQTATDESGATTKMDTAAVVNLMKQLSLVPSFITAQFVYDATFVQPIITK